MSVLKSMKAIVPLGMLALLAGCQPKNQFVPPPPPAVEVAHPSREPVRDFLEFTGTTRALDRVDLRARVNGYLQSIHFEDGATVKKGDLLFVIDQAPYRARIQIAQADLRKAETALQLGESELARSRILVQRNASSPQELDVKVAERDSAAASVAAAQAALRDAELQLGYTEIHAPIGGRIGRHMVDIGTLVMPEQTLLATIENYDPIHVYFTMSESDLLFLIRQRQEDGLPPVERQGLALEMGLTDEEGYPHRGKLDFAELGVDPETGTVMYRAVFENPGRMLVPGLFARLRTAISEPKPRILVPEPALGTDQRGDYVLVVGKDDTVEYRAVKLGRLHQGLRVVDGGLKEDEWIVVNGVQRARPGAKVATKRTEAVATTLPLPEPATATPAPGEPAASSAPDLPPLARKG